MKNEVIAGLIGMIILTCFLVGLAASIGHVPFWVIVLLVLGGGWLSWYQDTVLNPESD